MIPVVLGRLRGDLSISSHSRCVFLLPVRNLHLQESGGCWRLSNLSGWSARATVIGILGVEFCLIRHLVRVRPVARAGVWPVNHSLSV